MTSALSPSSAPTAMSPVALVAGEVTLRVRHGGEGEPLVLPGNSHVVQKLARASLAQWAAMKEGLPGGTLRVFTRSELEEARLDVGTLDWI
jgi:hypothetical protein